MSTDIVAASTLSVLFTPIEEVVEVEISHVTHVAFGPFAMAISQIILDDAFVDNHIFPFGAFVVNPFIINTKLGL